jgi:hypothetical protein
MGWCSGSRAGGMSRRSLRAGTHPRSVGERYQRV